MIFLRGRSQASAFCLVTHVYLCAKGVNGGGERPRRTEGSAFVRMHISDGKPCSGVRGGQQASTDRIEAQVSNTEIREATLI